MITHRWNTTELLPKKTICELVKGLGTKVEKEKEMSGTKDSRNGSSTGETLRIVKEQLNDTGTYLTNFFFRYGANVYVLSYEKEGERRHTFIDAGDLRYHKQMLPMLIENDIDPTKIERIIITHRHRDHVGLARLLATGSGAKITVHSNFRSFVEGEISEMERRWLGDLDPSQLKECDMEYLSQPSRNESICIGGVDFPSLVEPIDIGKVGKLSILACPESTATHSPDQVLVLYSPRSHPYTCEKREEDFRPTDDILFSGDLWLMRGPIFDRGLRHISLHLRYGYQRMKNLVSGKGMPWRDPREQDSQAKEALKRGFCLIRVKPGHGGEFVGTRIIPKSLLADRDLLVEFGYSMDAEKSILSSSEVAPKMADRMEEAYASFVEELLLWTELGYSSSEVSELLVRIYKEQSGGGSLVEEDRKERRGRIKATLVRLRGDEAMSDELHQLAESTLSDLKRVS